jgi:hypothetical protein
MAKLMLGCIMLYVGDVFVILLFLVGLAAAIEAIAKRSLSRLFLEVTPRQLAVAIYAQLGVLLIGLVGFKFIVLSGGPGIDTHTILRTGIFTRTFSIAALIVAWSLAAYGFTRLFKRLAKLLQKVSYK